MYSRITRFRASRSGLLRSSAVKSPRNKEVSELIQSTTTRQDVFVRNLRFMPVKRRRKFGSTNRRGPFMLFACVLYALISASPITGNICITPLGIDTQPPLSVTSLTSGGRQPLISAKSPADTPARATPRTASRYCMREIAIETGLLRSTREESETTTNPSPIWCTNSLSASFRG